ncbi:hypothetical protein FRB91_011004, partial [Serendipita sp. 411]
ALTPRSNTPTSVSFPPPVPDPEAEKPELEGGATPFFSRNLKRRLDVDPKAGRVLLFQHKDLFHSGDYVTAGVKYTMRTDLIREIGYRNGKYFGTRDFWAIYSGFKAAKTDA